MKNSNNIKLTTYNMNGKDDSVTVFEVDRKWLRKTVANEFEMTLIEFMNEYTYDTAEVIYDIAKSENQIISEFEELDAV